MIPVVKHPSLPEMSSEDIEKVRRLESNLLELPQIPIATHHVIHGGMYARTITIPAGAALTGALIRIPTLLIFDGDAEVFADGETKRLQGHFVLPGSAGRKQAFIAIADTTLTMVFPTQACSVAEAEERFTEEADLLIHRDEDTVIITGE